MLWKKFWYENFLFKIRDNFHGLVLDVSVMFWLDEGHFDSETSALVEHIILVFSQNSICCFSSDCKLLFPQQILIFTNTFIYI